MVRYTSCNQGSRFELNDRLDLSYALLTFELGSYFITRAHTEILLLLIGMTKRMPLREFVVSSDSTIPVLGCLESRIDIL